MIEKIKKAVKKFNDWRTVKGWKIGIIVKLPNQDKKKNYFYRTKGVDKHE